MLTGDDMPCLKLSKQFSHQFWSVKVSLNAWKVEMNIAGGRGSYTGYKSRKISRGTRTS